MSLAGIIRLVICAGIFFALFFIIKSKAKEESRRTWNIMALIMCVVIAFISTLAPVENAFVTFSSAKEAYEYWSGEGEVVLTLDGEENTLIVAMKSDGYCYHSVYPKAGDGWKISSAFNTEGGKPYNYNNIYIDYVREKSTGECFVQIMSVDGTLLELSDEYGTEYITCESLLSTNYKTYYAYIEEFDDDYVFSANGKEIALSDMIRFNG